MTEGPSDKSRTVALALGVFLGIFGAHRFYVGKTGTGLLMICTIGGLGLWYLYDLILIAGGGFRDADGRRVLHWEPEGLGSGSADARLLHQALDEVDALRHEVGELAERLDFAERLLAQPGQERRGPPT